jgi:hypothetical protein
MSGRAGCNHARDGPRSCAEENGTTQRFHSIPLLVDVALHLIFAFQFDTASLPTPLRVSTRFIVTVRAYAAEPIQGEVTFIYPELRMETRTARVRIEIPNPDGRLKVDMYADVVFHAGAGEEPCIAVVCLNARDLTESRAALGPLFGLGCIQAGFFPSQRTFPISLFPLVICKIVLALQT